MTIQLMIIVTVHKQILFYKIWLIIMTWITKNLNGVDTSMLTLQSFRIICLLIFKVNQDSLGDVIVLESG